MDQNDTGSRLSELVRAWGSTLSESAKANRIFEFHLKKKLKKTARPSESVKFFGLEDETSISKTNINSKKRALM